MKSKRITFPAACILECSALKNFTLGCPPFFDHLLEDLVIILSVRKIYALDFARGSDFIVRADSASLQH